MRGAATTQQTYQASLTGTEEVPAVTSTGTGTADVRYNTNPRCSAGA
jgi:hypothetical protein